MIEDATLQRWTILASDYEQADRVYDLTTVNLAVLFDLRHVATFYAPSATVDAAGARTPTFTAQQPSVSARFQLETGQEVEQRGQVGAQRTYSVYVEELPAAFTTDWQVRDGDGNIYDPVRWRNAQRLDELPVIECERRL